MSAGAPRDAGSQRRLVLVVGIGRSGTSLLTSILGRLGFHVPQPEVQADDTNPRGFGEPRWVVDFHTRLMRARRVTVFDSRPAAWATTAEAANDPAVVEELRSWLAVQFVGAENVVVKDPRIGWFLPLWLRCSDALGVRTSFATMLRYPPEVVSSARRWYGTWQNDASRAAAWLNVTLETERATRDASRAFVRYADLLEDWPREVSRVGELLDLPWLRGLDRARHADVDAVVDPTLRREAVGWSDVDVPPSVQAMVDDVWERVSRLADPDGDTEEVRDALDAARGAYAQLYAEAEAIAQSSVTAVKPRGKRATAAAAAAARASARRTPRASKVRRLVPTRIRARVPSPLRLARTIPPRHRERILVTGFRVLYALPLPAQQAALAAARRVARTLYR